MDFTVKEIAEILNVSKPTVQSIIHKLGFEPDNIVKDKYRYYSYEKVRIIAREYNPYFDFARIPTNTAKPLENTENTAKLPPETANDCEEKQNLAANDRMLSIIEQQLKSKDEIIANQAAEIARLREENSRDRELLQTELKEAYNKIAAMADKTQSILLAEKTAQIVDKVDMAADVVEQPEVKRKRKFEKLFSWFGR